jgi:anti-anti-sigma factor
VGDSGEPRDGSEIKVRVDPHQLTVHVHGELDPETVPALRSALHDAAHDPVAMDVWVDFTDCPYFDAQTVALLAAAAHRLRDANKQLSLEGLNDTQEAVARICGLHRVAAIYP